MREWISDKLETLRVKWFMLDAQQKQVLLMVGVYLFSAFLDIAKAYMQTKVTNGEYGKSE